MELYSCSILLATLFVHVMRQGRISLPVSPSEIDQCGSDPLSRAFFWEMAEITSTRPPCLKDLTPALTSTAANNQNFTKT